MPAQYSIAEARDHLARIVHAVERGKPVELTRRGKPVAVLVSVNLYRRSRGAKNGIGFVQKLMEFRKKHNLDAEGFDLLEVIGPRDKAPGREFKW